MAGLSLWRVCRLLTQSGNCSTLFVDPAHDWASRHWLNGTPIGALSRSTKEIGMAEIKEHMEVIGADGVHIGTVDKVEGHLIKLTKADSGEGKHKGHHHFIDLRLVAVSKVKRSGCLRMQTWPPPWKKRRPNLRTGY